MTEKRKSFASSLEDIKKLGDQTPNTFERVCFGLADRLEQKKPIRKETTQ